MCICIHASGVIGTVETTRFRRTNSYVQPIMWCRAAGGGARMGGAICSRLHGFRSFVQNRKVSTKTEVSCVWAFGGGKMAQKFDLLIKKPNVNYNILYFNFYRATPSPLI